MNKIANRQVICDVLVEAAKEERMWWRSAAIPGEARP